MKKLLSIMLAVAMIFTTVIIPVSISAATVSFDGNYVAGDTIYNNMEFYAGDSADLNMLSGTNVQTAEFNGEKYAYVSEGELKITFSSFGLPDNEPLYVMFRLHAMSGTGKAVFAYTAGGRAVQTLLDSEFGESGFLTEDIDVVFELYNRYVSTRPKDYSVYARPVGSTGKWALCAEGNKTYATGQPSGYVTVGNGWAVSSVRGYKKQAPELAAVNTAADAAAMSAALSTYVTQFGIDLGKLDGVENDNAVYATMLSGKPYTSAQAVADAFNAAVAAQISAELNIDFATGDETLDTFDASNYAESDITLASATLATMEVAGEQYVYPNGTALKVVGLDIPNPGQETVYVKLRFHAAYDNTNHKTVYIYTQNSTRLDFNLVENITNKADDTSTSAPGVDVILELKADGYTMYSRMADSDGAWAIDEKNGSALRPYSSAELNSGARGVTFYKGAALASAKVYKKLAPELVAVNEAADADAMAAALSANAEALGVDLNKLDGVEDDNAVYAAMLSGKPYASKQAVADAFNAAVAAQMLAEFDCDYVEGEDEFISSFDASKEADIKLLSTSKGTDVLTTEFGDGTYAHAATEGYLLIPQVLPTISSKGTVYVKFRIHAINDNSTGKVVYMYTQNSGNARLDRTLNNSEIGNDRLRVDSAAGVDVIYELTEDGFNVYAKTAGSNEMWTTLDTLKGYKQELQTALNLQFGLGISQAVVYKKAAPVVPVVTTLEKTADWSFVVNTNAEIEAGKVYVGAYDATDALVGVGIAEFNAAGTTVNMDAPTGTVTYFKAFIWDQNLTPLVDVPASLDNI